MTNLFKMNAEEIYESFVKANISCFDKIVYDEETDTNHLLGRPGQYVSKVNFNDVHYVKENPPCTVEVFTSEAEALARKEYVEKTISQYKLLTENQYMFLKGYTLVRIPYKVVPEHANKYDMVLDALLEGKDVTDMFEKEEYDGNSLQPQESDLSKILHKALDEKRAILNAKREITIEPANDNKNISFEEVYVLEDFKYCAPAGWLTKKTESGNYHYAKEIGKIDGGYIYCAKLQINSMMQLSIKKNGAYDSMLSMLDGMKKSGALHSFVGEKEPVEILNLNGIRYYANMDLASKRYPVGGLAVLGKKMIYSFAFIIEGYSFDDYKKLIDEFVVYTDVIEAEPNGLLGKLFKE